MSEDDEDHDLADVRGLLPGEELEIVDALASGDRSTVLRLRATTADGGQRGVILKRYHDGDGRRREPAALASVPGAVRVPAVLAAGDDLLLLEDLGEGSSVADALLGDDPTEAATAIVQWAEAVAELHLATRGSRERFAGELARRGDDLAESWLPQHVREAERLLDRHCGSLGVTIPTGAMAEFISLIERLGPDSSLAALTPADACPDNNVRVGDRTVLLDFEGAQWAHIAWDVAYLLVPWPTCWCSWAIPAEVRDRALARYRDIVSAELPTVAETNFLADIEAAAIGWCLMSAAFSLDFALGPEPELDHQVELDRPSPQRRALVLDRLERVAASAELPAAAELAGNLLAALRDRWPAAPLELAPAFRAGG